jgi:hypothetical protein
MSINYTSMIMYGKEFDCFEDALEKLLGNGHISEGEYAEAIDYGDLNDPDELLTWQVYSCYSGRSGVLGVEVSARDLYTQPQECAPWFASVDGKLGKGCEIHEFVQVC